MKNIENLKKALDFTLITDFIRDRISSSYGKAELETIEPLPATKALSRMKMIHEITELRLSYISFSFQGMNNIDKISERIKRGGEITLEELFLIRQTVNASERVRKLIGEKQSELTELSAIYLPQFIDHAALNEFLKEVITDEGEINLSIYPELKKISEHITSLKKDIAAKLSKLLHSPQYEKHIQEKIHDQRNGRYVILVKSSSRGVIPGTVFDISSSGQTIYLEPESIRESNSQLISRRVEFEIEISRILAEIVNRVADNADEISANAHLCGQIDFLNACSLFSSEIRGAVPTLSTDNAVQLFSARHPLLHIMKKELIVPNDIIIPADACGIIISGANAGGKTIALKTLGLCALMVRFGLPIPASPDSKIPFFTDILADIGDDQNISLSLSTYSGQINRIKEMIEQCGEGSLILVDEIISGTNPHYGAALARAVLEEFARKGAKILVTTHYPELKKLASENPRFINASVIFDPETLRPLYTLKSGIPGMSFTFEIAEILQLPEQIIKRGKEIAGSDELSFEALVDRVHRYETELLVEKSTIEELKKNLHQELANSEELKIKLKESIRNAKEHKGIEFIDEIRSMREQIQQRIRELNRMNLKESENLRSEVDSFRTQIESSVDTIKKEDLLARYKRADNASLQVGDRVLVSTLGTEGTVDSIDADGSTARVILGNAMKSRFKTSDLMKIASAPKEKKRTVVHQSVREDQTIPVTIQTEHNTIDLRGFRVEEGLTRLENALDAMIRKNISTVVIIHGHGTGAMKEAVRSLLKHSHYIDNFRPGADGEGGNGVTIARLK